MAKAKPKPKPEAPVEKAPDWQRAVVSITKTKAEVIHKEVDMAQYRKLVAIHGGEKVKVLEVIE